MPNKKLNRDTLIGWPLPDNSNEGDKESRGHILIIAGSRETPGAVILAANAALRAGAGKLTIATGISTATSIAIAIPESKVIGLPENIYGGLDAKAAHLLDKSIDGADAVLIGPGMQDESATCDLVTTLLPKLSKAKLVLDACAMSVMRKSKSSLFNYDAPVLLTPHAGEMAHLLDITKEEVQESPQHYAEIAARDWNSIVIMKGATTFIALPKGTVWQHDGNNIGLAISGSGDTLAGIISGLAASGASLEQAGAWGVVLHALAGDELAKRVGQVGFFAREIADEIPRLIHTF
jgi:ADP-dependent NAD(P)H-hydrate dehydratase